MTDFDCVDIINVPTTKSCSCIDCVQINPQQLCNFTKNPNSKDGKESFCKFCISRRRTEKRVLQKFFAIMKTTHIDQFKTTVACVYISQTHTCNLKSKRLLNNFKLTEQELIEILKDEQVFQYKICISCQQLKPFDEYYKMSKNSLQSICILCQQDLYKK